MTLFTPECIDAVALALLTVDREDAIETIKQLHNTTTGAELLRRMNIDPFPGVSDLIDEALWANL